MNPHVELLKEFADGEHRDIREPDRVPSALWLYDNGFLAGAAFRPLSGTGVLLNARITAKGYDFLNQVAKENEAQCSRERAYQTKYPIRAGIVVAASGGLLLAAILALFGWIL